MSLFYPNTPDERLEQLTTAGWCEGSGEPVPQLSDAEARQLEVDLLKCGLEIKQSRDHGSGWEYAYDAFANAFLRSGATLTERLRHIDIPNMLFNFSLTNGWFPHLTLLTEAGTPYHFLSPRRVPIEHFATTGGSRFHEIHNKRQQLGWYRKRIGNAVLNWDIKVAEQRINDPDNQFPQPPEGFVADDTLHQLSISTPSPREPKADVARRKPKAKRTKKWPSHYQDGTETPKRILDVRRRKTWPVLHQLIEKEYVAQELIQREALGVDTGPKPSFGMASLFSIRRGKNLPQAKLEAVAAVMNRRLDPEPKRTPILWTNLRWDFSKLPLELQKMSRL